MASQSAVMNRVVRISKRDGGRHHDLMARESDPQRAVRPVVANKPPARVAYNPDRSGLGKMAGTVTRRVSDQYRGLHEQQVRLRKEALNRIADIEVDAVEFEAFLKSIGRK